MDYLNVLTVDEVAKGLKVKAPTIRGWLREKKLAGLKLPGGDWRIRQEDLDTMLEP